MSIRIRGKCYYVAFRWKGFRMEASTSATNMADAKKIEKAVKTAFKIYRFDHLDSVSLEVACRLFDNKGWKLPAEIQIPEPQGELTLLRAIQDYLDSDDKRNRTERKLFAIDRLVEFFEEHSPLGTIKVADVKRYRRARQNLGIANGTINIEVSTLSGIFREQLERETIDFNPCSPVRRLPKSQRDSYISWTDFNRIVEVAGWLEPIIVMMYFTGMRPSEVFDLDWSEIDFARRMMVLPPSRTKEGKNENQQTIHEKRIPMRSEVSRLLESMRRPDSRLVNMTGRIFTHRGRPITRGTKRKCWSRICRCTDLGGLQLRDFRHTFKTNLAHSQVDETIMDAIVGHATQLEVRKLYIHCPDSKLLEAVDWMTFDHGPTAVGYQARQKSDVKMTTKERTKKTGHAVT